MSRNLFHLAALVALGALAGRAPAGAQGTLDSVTADPSPACADSLVTATVEGTGTCQSMRLSFDYPNLTAQSVVNPSFPVTLTHTYATAGTYTIRAGSADANCTGDPETTLVVNPCNWQLDAALVDTFITALKPVIAGGLGLVQPGNPFPILVFGEKFGPNPGKLFLDGAFGTVELPVLEWGSDGAYIGASIPAGICGVPDHEAAIRVVTALGWASDPWPVLFTAAREVLPLPRDAVQVLSCGSDSNKDCCNSQCDEDDNDWFSACLSPNSSICGSHMNAWAAIGDDQGTDTYRVDLTGGSWVIEGWSFQVSVEPGEGWAQFQPGNAYHETVADFSAPWLVSANDTVIYDSFIYISGPCGTSFKPGVAQSALLGAASQLQAQAGFSEIDRAAFAKLRELRSGLDVDLRRRAARDQRRIDGELSRRRAAATPEAAAAAVELAALQREGRELLRRAAAAAPAGGRERLAAEAAELGERLRRVRPVPVPVPPPPED